MKNVALAAYVGVYLSVLVVALTARTILGGLNG